MKRLKRYLMQKWSLRQWQMYLLIFIVSITSSFLSELIRGFIG